MNKETQDRLEHLGIKLQWSSQGNDIQWLLTEPWIILVHDPPTGGYWTVYPKRELTPDGKRRTKPEGIVFSEEKPHELAQVLREAGIGDVWLVQLVVREKLTDGTKVK